MTVTAKFISGEGEERKVYQITTSGNIQTNALTGEEVDIGFSELISREVLENQLVSAQAQLDLLNAKIAAIDALHS